MGDKLRKKRIDSEVLELIETITEENEAWMPHPTYDSFYGSDRGRFASVSENRKRIRILNVGRKLELTRGTYKDGVAREGYMRKQFLPHRFLWECFYGLINDTRQIVFKDGNKANRRLDNMMLLAPAKRIKIQSEG